MSILIIALTLISFNLHAITHEIKPNKQGVAGYTIDDSEQSLEKQYKRLSKKSSWMKCKENDKAKDALFSKTETYTEQVDTGETEMSTGIDGNEIEVPVYSEVEIEVITHFHPDNFTIIDKSQEVIDRKSDKESRKAETALIKKMDNEIKNSNLPEWHKKLLERLIKDIRE